MARIQPTYLSIEGNIGSGKSTLLNNLKKAFKNDSKVVFLKEPVDEWEAIQDEKGNTMLEKFYGNQKKYSFSFQMMAYISRLATFKKAVFCIIIAVFKKIRNWFKNYRNWFKRTFG
jgi:deoxyadenosine/deoxycytidine kinase